jgi:hypothetical protein
MKRTDEYSAFSFAVYLLARKSRKMAVASRGSICTQQPSSAVCTIFTTASTPSPSSSNPISFNRWLYCMFKHWDNRARCFERRSRWKVGIGSAVVNSHVRPLRNASMSIGFVGVLGSTCTDCSCATAEFTSRTSGLVFPNEVPWPGEKRALIEWIKYREVYEPFQTLCKCKTSTAYSTL